MSEPPGLSTNPANAASERPDGASAPSPDNPAAPMVHHCLGLLRQRFAGREPASGLLVGCGNGDEVIFLRRAFHNSSVVVGIDVDARFSTLAREEGCVIQGDALKLPFESETFDFVAAFHSLEHIGSPQLALDEVRRALRPGGWFYLGVPNRTRIFGYLGSFDTTMWQKIAWNLNDWSARLRGKFRNEQGSHAGFERKELADMLADRFRSVRFLTEEYIRFKYGGRMPRPLLNLLLAPGIVNYSTPAHYALCQKA